MSMVHVAVGSSYLPCIESEDKSLSVVLKPSIESLGIDYSSAVRRLRRSSWATMVMMTTVAEDGKLREMVTVSVQTWVMFLATVEESRVSKHLRPQLVEFQRESMEALTRYWTEGFAINHRATEEQLRKANVELRKQLDASEQRRFEDAMDYEDHIEEITLIQDGSVAVRHPHGRISAVSSFEALAAHRRKVAAKTTTR